MKRPDAALRRWGLQAAVVGRVLEEPIVRVLHHGAVAAVPATALADDTPIEKHALLEAPCGPAAAGGNGMNGVAGPRTRERLCLLFWMTRPLRASAGFTGNTTSGCWPARWCRPVLPMPLSCGSNRERVPVLCTAGRGGHGGLPQPMGCP